MAEIKIGYSNGKTFNGRSPVLRVVTSEIVQQRRTGLKYSLFEQKERCSTSTIRNWMNGTVKRPQFDKVNGVLDLLGKEIVIRDKR